MYLPAGQILVRSLHRGQEIRHEVTAGTVSYAPANGERQTLVGEFNAAHDYFTLLIPPRDARLLAASEGLIWNIDDLSCFVAPDDTVLNWCMSRLAVRPSQAGDAEARKDTAARRLIMRLQELSGGRVPAWQLDTSVFDRATLQRFVNRRRVLASIPLLQANASRLAHIALDLGFSSQSHFTRLFGDLTGMTPAKYRKQFRRTVG